MQLIHHFRSGFLRRLLNHERLTEFILGHVATLQQAQAEHAFRNQPHGLLPLGWKPGEGGRNGGTARQQLFERNREGAQGRSVVFVRAGGQLRIEAVLGEDNAARRKLAARSQRLGR